ncbi:hypothetical protein EPN90_03950 [Patescibacteria group bacterium]|nr:MAG: hypothetical protein EPN90_03950 [Patescibacteria group bacterium]
MWLLARFWPPAKDAAFDFVSAKERDPGDPARIWVGVGRGKFDEHKGDLGESAASLVFRFIKETRKGLASEELNALTRLVLWIRDEDTGLHDKDRDREWTPAPLLRQYYDLHDADPARLTQFGFEILAATYAELLMREQLVKDWENRLEFESPWGRAVALETAAYGADEYAYQQGFILLVLIDSRRGFRGFRAAPDSNVDLTAAYETLRRADPKADWYLHHSRKLLLCGSDVAPDSKLSKLGLRDLVRVLQPVGGK